MPKCPSSPGWETTGVGVVRVKSGVCDVRRRNVFYGQAVGIWQRLREYLTEPSKCLVCEGPLPAEPYLAVDGSSTCSRDCERQADRFISRDAW